MTPHVPLDRVLTAVRSVHRQKETAVSAPEPSVAEQATATVTVRAEAYSVCAYPREDINRLSFEIRVEYRGNDRWAVLRRGFCLNRSDDDWDWEFIPSERRDDWLNDHRWGLDEALAAAKRHAVDVTVNGCSIADALALADGAR